MRVSCPYNTDSSVYKARKQSVCKCNDPCCHDQRLPNHVSASPAEALASCFRSALINDVFILRSKSSPACSPPSPATASSSASLVNPRRSMSSSIELRVISFTTSTSRFCPIRYARSCACLSLCGLKSWSKLWGSFRCRGPNITRYTDVQDDNTCRGQIDAHATCFS